MYALHNWNFWEALNQKKNREREFQMSFLKYTKKKDQSWYLKG